MRRKLFCLTIAAMMVPGVANAQSVSDGIAAWRGGEPERAVEIWTPLAEAGDADAQFNLAQAYRLGRGVEADPGEARRLFRIAAEQGNIGARTNLGLMLFSEGNREAGLGWLRGAAEAGEARALLVYGTALFNGDPLDRDLVTGYALVSRAAAQDLVAAEATLGEMDKVLSVDDRRAGVALAQRLASGTSRLEDVLGPQEEVAASEPMAPKPEPETEVAQVAPQPRPASEASLSGSYRVQLGAFRRDGAAQELFARLSDADVFEGKQPIYGSLGSLTSLRVGPFTASEARAACAAMDRRDQPCIVIAP